MTVLCLEGHTGEDWVGTGEAKDQRMAVSLSWVTHGTSWRMGG